MYKTHKETGLASVGLNSQMVSLDSLHYCSVLHLFAFLPDILYKEKNVNCKIVSVPTYNSRTACIDTCAHTLLVLTPGKQFYSLLPKSRTGI